MTIVRSHTHPPIPPQRVCEHTAGGRGFFVCDDDPKQGTLWNETPADVPNGEQAALEQAKAQGWYCQSGRTLESLRAWQRWCRAAGRRCIVVKRGAQEGAVLVNGVEVLKAGIDDLEAEAARIAQEEPK